MTKHAITNEGRMTSDLRHVVCFAAMAFAFALNADADDVILAGPTEQTKSRRTGEIVDYTGAGLVLRVAGGAQTTIPAERVLEVRADWNAPHRAGDELFAEGKFADALAQYRQAVGQEQRPWVRRRLTEQAVWCYRNLRQHEYAASSFLSLASQDPATPHFDAIPLAWTSTQPDAAFNGKLRKWIEDENSIVSLVAASWLLTTPERSAAEEKLRALVGDADPRVSLLAQAQLWRTQQAIAKTEDVARWRSAVERIPDSLRAGPYYLIGQALARLGAGQEATLVLLRVAVLYPRHRELAAESLLAAGRELEKLARADEAKLLFHELAAEYTESPLAELARQRLAAGSSK